MADGWEDLTADGWKTISSKDDGWETLTTGAKNFVGGLDAAANIAAGIPAYIASGVHGLGTLLTTGSIDKAGDAVRSTQESNFGMGKPKPFTKAGQEVVDMIGDISQKGIKKAGEAGYKVGGELGRTHGEIAAETILNFLPIPGGKAVRKLANAIERKPATPTKPPLTAEDILSERAETVKAEASKQWQDLPDSQITPEVSRLHDQDIIQKLTELDKERTAAQRRSQAMFGEKVFSEEPPIYVDPQAQAFRGDPKAPEAPLALERQTEAADVAMETNTLPPPGEPLPLLQDPGQMSNTGPQLPFDFKNQGGGLNLDAIGEGLRDLKDSLFGESKIGMSMAVVPHDQRPVRADNINHPITPETIAERQHARQVANQFPVRNKALDEFDVIRTKEEALELGKNWTKDISPDVGQKSLGSGINFQVAMSNSPILKYARTILRDARATAEKFSREYITDKTVGLSPIWSKLSPDARIRVMRDLYAGDKHQTKITSDLMDQLGYSPEMKQFVDTFYKADDTMFTKWNESLAERGMKPIRDRTGHVPGVFVGAYKTIAVRPSMKDGKPVLDKNGKPVMENVGVIATDTMAQQRLAQNHVRESMPDVTFIERPRSDLTGTANRYYSDIWSGTNDALELLSQHDPVFKEVQSLINDAIKKSNHQLFQFNVHELAKKGVFGNEGNKPWLSPERNANDAFKALVRYFEEGALHHELQIPLQNLKELTMAPELKHLPNTTAYLEKYLKKVEGKDVSPLGGAINTILDTPFKILPTLSWGNGKVTAGVGVGPGIPIRMSAAIKNEMSHLFMGYGNAVFTAMQLLQVPQTGMPFLQLAAGRLGLSPVEMTASMGKGLTGFLVASMEHMTGEKTPVLADHLRIAHQYALDRGMLTFSEMETALQGTHNKLVATKDKIAEFNMKIGEQLTRTPVFMAFTDLLVKGGLDIKQALPIAENMTQFSMVDYHPWERPGIYSQLGVLGSFAGGLATFKHSLVSQQLKLGKELLAGPPLVKGPDGVYAPAGKRQVLPIAMSVAGMMALTGIVGAPFYQEADQIFQYLTDAYGGARKTLREAYLEKLPEWANTGALSSALDVNLQGRFSAADMVPDTLGKAASPHLEAFSKILMDVIDLAKSGGDEIAIRNLLMSLTPSGWKGATENAVARTPDNYTVNREGENVVQRTDEEWKTRAITGLKPHHEVLGRESVWSARSKLAKDEARLKEISTEYARAIRAGTIDKKADALEEEYEARGGDVKSLHNLYKSVTESQGQSEKERLEGIPRNRRSAERWLNYNK